MRAPALTPDLDYIRSVAFDDLGWGFVSTIELPGEFGLPQMFEVLGCARGGSSRGPWYCLQTPDGARAARAHGLFLLRLIRHGARPR